MHVEADDPHHDLWPDPDDVLGVLAYTRVRHRALLPATDEQRQRADQAATRLTIIRAVRTALDNEELSAIDDARAAGTQWAAIAELLGLEYPGSAMNRRNRLLGALEDPQRRRTPAAGNAVIVKRLRERDREGRAAAAIARRHGRIVEAAEALLAHADELEVSDECATIWLAGVRESLDIVRPTAREQQRLANYLGITIGEILSQALSEGIPPARTPEAHAALARASALRDELHQALYTESEQ
ncbi:hypothetical protein [Actinomadura napierensis]|uniref:Transcriptional regulator n=1 Tax=Actinomadura napierensis TaxID=267854 RepID=A0ABP5M8G5_9ACTN